MPHLFEFDSGHRLFRWTAWGEISEEELLRYYRQAEHYVELIDPVAGILDLSGVTSFRISPALIRSIANTRPIMPDPRRPRYVVAPADHVYGMMRMFQIMGESTRPTLCVVRTLREAWEALGIPDPVFRPIAPEPNQRGTETS